MSNLRTIAHERNNAGKLTSVFVPLLTDRDPAWYKRAAALAGISKASAYRVDCRRFLTVGDANKKIGKSDKRSADYLSAILHLAPHKMCGLANVCPQAHGCGKVCVGFNGNGVLRNEAFADVRRGGQRWLVHLVATALRHHVHRARIAKTRLFYLNRELFYESLEVSVDRFVRRCDGHDKQALIRPNGTSDIAWESLPCARWGNQTVFDRWPTVQWYDYTKLAPRAARAGGADWPRNYDLTFSRDETNERQALAVLRAGGRVAAVIRTGDMVRCNPAALRDRGYAAIDRAIVEGIPGFEGFPVVSGDSSDLRHLDPMGAIVALYAKNRAARDDSGFVVDLH